MLLEKVLEDLGNATEIFVMNDGQQAGPYQLDFLRNSVQTGTLSKDSWAWHKDLQEWKSLEAVLADFETPLEIFLLENGIQTGPFTLEDLAARLEAGTIAMESWVWHRGLAEWIAITVLLPGVTRKVEVPPSPVPSPVSAKKTGEVALADQKSTIRIKIPPSFLSRKTSGAVKLMPTAATPQAGKP